MNAVDAVLARYPNAYAALERDILYELSEKAQFVIYATHQPSPILARGYSAEEAWEAAFQAINKTEESGSKKGKVGVFETIYNDS